MDKFDEIAKQVARPIHDVEDVRLLVSNTLRLVMKDRESLVAGTQKGIGMATSKKEALARFSGKAEQDASILRKRIEEAILQYDGSPVRINFSGFLNGAVLVAAEYRAVGWNVEFVSDQGDGDYLVLS